MGGPGGLWCVVGCHDGGGRGGPDEGAGWGGLEGGVVDAEFGGADEEGVLDLAKKR